MSHADNQSQIFDPTWDWAYTGMIEANDPMTEDRLLFASREFISALYGDTSILTQISSETHENIEVGSFEVWTDWEAIINHFQNDDDIFGTADQNYPVWGGTTTSALDYIITQSDYHDLEFNRQDYDYDQIMTMGIYHPTVKAMMSSLRRLLPMMAVSRL